MNLRLHRGAAAAAAATGLLALVSACGGGVEGTGGVPDPVAAASYSTGVMQAGSVIVNGVRYTDDGATQVFDDRGRVFAALTNGMVVKLRGRRSSETSGVAERVKVENELRGPLDAAPTGNPPKFTVRGVPVQTDESTEYANVTGAAQLQAGNQVEVHGLRDAGGVIRASRVELLTGADASLDDELRGSISTALAGDSFVLGSGTGAVTVTLAASPTFGPAGCARASLTAGTVVEVRGEFTGAGQFSATRVECEDAEDSANGVKPVGGARNEIEGFITEFTSPDGNQSGSFKVNGITVNFGAATQVRNGIRADLANGARVEVDGTLNGTTIDPTREIAFKQDRIILQATISDFASGSFTLLGTTVVSNDLTAVDPDITPADGLRVEVRGRLLGSTVVADEIREVNNNDTRQIVQARVQGKGANSVTLLGRTYSFNAGACGAADCAALLAAISADPATATLLKVRGDPLSAGIDEVEIED